MLSEVLGGRSWRFFQNKGTLYLPIISISCASLSCVTREHVLLGFLLYPTFVLHFWPHPLTRVVFILNCDLRMLILPLTDASSAIELVSELRLKLRFLSQKVQLSALRHIFPLLL